MKYATVRAVLDVVDYADVDVGDAHSELGVLVWQDFQFACGVYPAHDEFVQSVKQEAIDNVTRLRHHPSIALFCGNNEGTSVYSDSFGYSSHFDRLSDGSPMGRYGVYQSVHVWPL